MNLINIVQLKTGGNLGVGIAKKWKQLVTEPTNLMLPTH